MNTFALIFFLVSSALLLVLPRRYAPLPLLVGACYMTLGQAIEMGPANMPVLRLLVLVGLLRVLVRGERLPRGVNALDKAMVLFAAAALVTSRFHNDAEAQLIFSLGLVFNTCGIYFLLRIFCHTAEDVLRLTKMTAVLLVPLATTMTIEAMTGHNVFAVLGGVPPTPDVREGRIRAQGPFAHSILAGTVGAVCVPLMVGLWYKHRVIAMAGITAAVVMVLASASSGPLMSLGAALAALGMWRFREQMFYVRVGAVVGYIALDLVMKAPPYFLLQRIDLAGGSTGWHRAELIDTSLRHLHEWWLYGTDYTRHWMPSGVSWSPDHVDITNHYIQMGIVGGLPLMFLFILTLVRGFSFVGQTVKRPDASDTDRFVAWTLGAALFAHAATSVSVSYFDQSFMFLYLTLALIGSTWSSGTQAHAGTVALPPPAASMRSRRGVGALPDVAVSR